MPRSYIWGRTLRTAPPRDRQIRRTYGSRKIVDAVATNAEPLFRFPELAPVARLTWPVTFSACRVGTVSDPGEDIGHGDRP